MGKLRVLLLERNSVISETLSVALSPNYSISTLQNSQKIYSAIRDKKPDIIILDLNATTRSGLEICSELRTIGVTAPILILGNRDSLETRIKLFEAGADDYITKPFSLGEFKARLRVIARRLETYNLLLSTLGSPKLILDSQSRSVIRDGSQSIKLRRKEFAILEYLLKNAGETVSRQHLATYAWKNTNDPWSNTVDVHIKNLRDKIDKPFKRKLITTIHGHGYRLENS